jgi:hypothetical protein
MPPRDWKPGDWEPVVYLEQLPPQPCPRCGHAIPSATARGWWSDKVFEILADHTPEGRPALRGDARCPGQLEAP